MKQMIYKLMLRNNIERGKVDIDLLYRAGIKNIIDNLEYYYDKPYTCESVLKELFESGVIDYLNKNRIN